MAEQASAEENKWIVTDHPILDENGEEWGTFRFIRPQFITAVIYNAEVKDGQERTP